MASSPLGVSCTKTSKGVFKTQSYIQDGAFARIVNGFKYFPQKTPFQMFDWGLNVPLVLNVLPDVLIYILLTRHFLMFYSFIYKHIIQDP